MLPRIAVECRAVADPELRFAPSGTAVARLRVVASDRRKNPETQEWEDSDTLWLDVTAFKQLAENLAESVVKGDLLVVTGKIRTEQWESAEGEKRSKVALIADTVSASMQFRTIPHSSGRAQRSSEPPTDDPWTAGQTEDPPFRSRFLVGSP